MEKRFCPNCGSRKVEPKHEDVWGFRKSISTWKCTDCGYSGFVPEGDPEDYDFERDDEELKDEEIQQYEADIPLFHLVWVTSLILIVLYIAYM